MTVRREIAERRAERVRACCDRRMLWGPGIYFTLWEGLMKRIYLVVVAAVLLAASGASAEVQTREIEYKEV